MLLFGGVLWWCVGYCALNLSAVSNCKVASGAVLLKSVPAGCTVGGCPAKILAPKHMIDGQPASAVVAKSKL